MKNKKISENNAFINYKKKEQLKETFFSNIYKNEKFLVDKKIKLKKTYEKNYAFNTKIKRLKIKTCNLVEKK